VTYIQDYVHVAVKLKARLLKPSTCIILPLGAGSHHLKMVLNTFTKDQHGIWYKDLEHKDKQTENTILSNISDKDIISTIESLQGGS